MTRSSEGLPTTVARRYLTPQPFEERLYELLGVRLFKRYLPTSGDLVMRCVWKTRTLDSTKKDALMKYANGFTVACELTHLAGCAACVLYLSFFLATPLWFVVTANLLVNVYPVMLQRYNRARIYRLLQKRGNQINRHFSSTAEVVNGNGNMRALQARVV
ncbi:MAG: hypothetical protein A3C93_00075 [Candidatus Lloydbacteria bacterium RIFCSPHIGHO2_02_FULL_54_17]|uniref:Glycosyl-4,4'-diaponeurosporenoate acyltransferase n=1 Tax=Candidatus Lloydbacteria bacterium RIFCSPHIGHO2_02_FULL_54_17 TaxID=1798664 RepID=A0A1G2DK73_9BACT|nr:MAG: hypothetical protein A3C93_00075 [Candidatus Lloydbacteria bacterium RIFCSPHIGHO2_02_FULL_54_17]OGZ17108.1 MAG: hypothetical protein A3H76_02875 [Candidatus Lloydbacteria bacterium RIFCSPLOWO2_02_FULL_54_12]